MYCKKCGFEIEDNKATQCPACQAKIKRDSFPVWVIVILVLFTAGFFILPIIGIVAAITLPTLMMNTNEAKNKVVFKKTISTLSQAMLMDKAISGKSYTKFDDVWNKSIKNQLLNPVDIANGIRLNDLTEIKYTKLNDICNSVHDKKEISDRTACAVLTIDADGFDKGQNRHSMHTGIHDQFRVMLYSDMVIPVPNTVEDELIKGTYKK
jgi:type II secretory pathway pseudopilin PulG